MYQNSRVHIYNEQDALVVIECVYDLWLTSNISKTKELLSRLNVGNVSRALRGEMPELTGAEEKAKA